MAFTSNTVLAPVDSSSGSGFASMGFSGLVAYSCYWSPDGSINIFETFLVGLESDIRSSLQPEMYLIVAEDFNAKFPS